MTDISRRKSDHLELCASGQVAFRERTTLLEDVLLVHEALPERALKDIDLTTTFLGRSFSAPFMLTGMTGGTERARDINRDLARACAAMNVPLGIGSQRAMVLKPDTAGTYDVREAAPSVFLLGNLGIVQARAMTTAAIRELAHRVNADALCIHLNPAMELVQDGGDRDFSGGLETLRRLAGELDLPLLVKETGAGLSQAAIEHIRSCGITNIDVAGAGGTSWTGVEALRQAGTLRQLGEWLWDWGIPTAVSVVLGVRAGMTVVASGGIRTGLDAVRALALGATMIGIAQPALRAQQDNGERGVRELLECLIEATRCLTLLTGASRPSELAKRPRVIKGELAAWLAQLEP